MPPYTARSLRASRISAGVDETEKVVSVEQQFAQILDARIREFASGGLVLQPKNLRICRTATNARTHGGVCAKRRSAIKTPISKKNPPEDLTPAPIPSE